jgi:serine O-acetyltransferase
MKQILMSIARKVYYDFKYPFYFPFLILPSIAYLLLFGKDKENLIFDIEAFYRVEIQKKIKSYYGAFYRLMVSYPAFRNVFYHRLGRTSFLFDWTLRRRNTLEINTNKIGGGIYIQQGTSTIITAQKIGDNFWVNQNVTVGWQGPGCPIIGNNVRIGTGAVVLGPITIGDNVRIGANATVLKDVPSNTTVVSPMAHICRRDGKKVYEELS